MGIQRCEGLETVHLEEGLEEIGNNAFMACVSLREIEIHPAIEVIKDCAFSQLIGVHLAEGLEEIRHDEFLQCRSFQRIVIPSTVTVIHVGAFNGCINITNVLFCDEIQVFVTAESMRDHGIRVRSPSTHCFLVRCSIPQRLGHILVRCWWDNIHDMLRSIPIISYGGLNAYFGFVDSMLSAYETLSDAPMLLELAIWNSKIPYQLGRNNESHHTDMRKRRRIDSVSMVSIRLLSQMFYPSFD